MMSPAHVPRVVELAWLLLALAFKQQHSHAAALQAHVFQRLAAHHAALLLPGKAAVGDAYALWATTAADAACRLLRWEGFHGRQWRAVMHAMCPCVPRRCTLAAQERIPR